MRVLGIIHVVLAIVGIIAGAFLFEGNKTDGWEFVVLCGCSIELVVLAMVFFWMDSVKKELDTIKESVTLIKLKILRTL